jgi:protein-disulfide isomerase
MSKAIIRPIRPDTRAPTTAIRFGLSFKLKEAAAQHQAFISSLRSQANVVIHLEPPPIYRVEVSVEGAPIRGSGKAAVTIVEFSDFHCPYCRQVQPTRDPPFV